MKRVATGTIVSLTLLVVASRAPAAGYGPFPAFAGSHIPATASVFGAIAVGQLGAQPYRLGYYLDANGDVSAEFADVANSLGSGDGIQSLLGAYVSPSDPAVVYALYSPEGGGRLSILVLRRTGDNWSQNRRPRTVSKRAGQYATATSNAVVRKALSAELQSSWTNIVARVGWRRGIGCRFGHRDQGGRWSGSFTLRTNGRRPRMMIAFADHLAISGRDPRYRSQWPSTN